MKAIVLFVSAFGFYATSEAATFNVSIQSQAEDKVRTLAVVVQDGGTITTINAGKSHKMILDTSTIGKLHFEKMRGLNQLPAGIEYKCNSVICTYGVPADIDTGDFLEVKARSFDDSTTFDIKWRSSSLEAVRQVYNGALIPSNLPQIRYSNFFHSVTVLNGQEKGAFEFPGADDNAAAFTVKVSKLMD